MTLVRTEFEVDAELEALAELCALYPVEVASAGFDCDWGALAMTGWLTEKTKTSPSEILKRAIS